MEKLRIGIIGTGGIAHAHASAYKAFDDVEVYSMTKETVVYATIVVSLIPMLIVYPYIQKFFVKGMLVGAVKG